MEAPVLAAATEAAEQKTTTSAGRRQSKTGVAAVFNPDNFVELTQEELLAARGNSDGGAANRVSGSLCKGLGTGIGGQLARTALGSAGFQVIEALKPRPETPLEPTPRRNQLLLEKATASLLDAPEPRGMWIGLALDNRGPPSNADLEEVRSHRWSFSGAAELAERGQSACSFVRCLLELQRNVQLEDAGEALEKSMVTACRLFVAGQCRDGRHGEMYRLLTHFMSNSRLFLEWDAYLRQVFAADSAVGSEAQVAVHLEQVWPRFRRLEAALREIFSPLDNRRSWRHRLPKVEALVYEHMRRRCFSSEVVLRNEVFAHEKCNNETLREIKRAFGMNS